MPTRSKGKKKNKLPAWMPETLQTAAAKPRKKHKPENKSAKTRPDMRDQKRQIRSGERTYEVAIPGREEILRYLRECAELTTFERLVAGLKLHQPLQADALSKRLAAMVRDGQLLLNRRGGYGLADKLDLIAGQVLANPEGYGFLRPDQGGEDVFLAPGQMRRVLHGDRVLVSVTGQNARGKREGLVVEILQRRSPRLVGRYQVQKGVGLVAPDDARLQAVLIPGGQEGKAVAGQIVVVEVIEPPTQYRQPIGKIVAILGEKLTPSLLVSMAIENHALPHEWPPEVLKETDSVEPKVLKEEIKRRVDLRKCPLVTIDGADARDFDDAVFCEPLGAGGYRLIVAIADVAHYVQPGTALDDEAYNRSTSVYFPGFVVPMLPEALSNGICSLNPEVERLCMVCEMHVDANGETTRSSFYEAVMCSHARLTYDKVWQAIGEKNQEARQALGGLLPHVENLHALYGIFAKQRKKRGAIEFESKEFQFRLAASGDVVAMGAYERNDAHRLIEECMIAANVQAALFLQKRKVPAPYRVHATPPMEKYNDLLLFLKEFQLRLPPWEKVRPADFAELMLKVQKRPDRSLLESVLLRSQSLAVYQPDNEGHFGLALEAYAHFTSPIRRYPDLLVHRGIKHAIQQGKGSEYMYSEADMTRMSLQCSKHERRADEAERDVDERYKCAWMEKHVGSEFAGVVSGVAAFGLFVELENKITGLVHVTQLPNDYYHFDNKRHLLTGEKRGQQYQLGDAVRVLVLRASLEDGKIDFRLVAESAKDKKRR